MHLPSGDKNVARGVTRSHIMFILNILNMVVHLDIMFLNMYESSHMVRWVVGSILHGVCVCEPIELFLVPASAP